MEINFANWLAYAGIIGTIRTVTKSDVAEGITHAVKEVGVTCIIDGVFQQLGLGRLGLYAYVGYNIITSLASLEEVFIRQKTMQLSRRITQAETTFAISVDPRLNFIGQFLLGIESDEESIGIERDEEPRRLTVSELRFRELTEQIPPPVEEKSENKTTLPPAA
ncbi:MAG TPA: hypothetical protein VLF61_03990 [Rhabdochlamydiaceae bacterium]|nr:hypothetical protein [Rhabdochlamydiaceae bacterium]